MKNRLSKSLAFSAILMMLLSTMAIFPAYALPGPEMYMIKSDSVFDTSTTSPCYKWNVTLWIRNITSTWAFQVRLNIIPPGDWINITGAWLAAADPAYIFAGLASVQPPPALTDSIPQDGCYDSVLIGDSCLLSPNPGGAGPFKLGTVELHLVKPPEKYETLFADLNIENADGFLLDPGLVSVEVTGTDGSVTYGWSAPATDPHMAVVPDYILFDLYTNTSDIPKGDFSVDIYIENLDLGWALHNASFNLLYDPAILSLMGTTVDAAWVGPNNVGVVPGMISVFVQGHPAPIGDVLVCTIDFRVIFQDDNPPISVSTITFLTFTDIILWDTIGTIPTEPSEEGEVEIEPLLVLEMPYFEVVPEHTVLGPELVICEQYGMEFDILIDIKNLTFAWYMVGFNMRLTYDPAIVEIVSITEGPFMQDPTWNWYGTFPIVIGPEAPNPFCPEWHYILADMILPNGTGYWDQPEPEGDGTVFIITVKPLVQSWVDTYLMDFEIYPIFPGEYMVDELGGSIPVNEAAIVDGDLTILPISPAGRRIDVWFINPDNGGYGLGVPADLVLPQTEITLTAKVTYNWWHVQYKKVTFEVRDCNGDLWAIFQDDTDDEGHAYTTFRMPWPCEGAEDLLGKWTITVSVTLADVVITDWVIFDYDYLVRIWKVTTDKLEYAHCEDVEITVEYGTHAMRLEDVILAVTITDELGVPIGVVLVELTVGGAEFCTYMNYTTTVTIHVDKLAYAGIATVHASFLNGLPSEGGEAVAQEVTTTFWILPH